MKCQECGFENPSDAEFCEQCTAVLSQKPEARTAVTGPRVGLIILWLLVFVSLALNGYLIFTLYQARSAALDTLTSVRNSVAQLSREPFTITVNVDEQIPIETVVPISETFTVPLDFVYPLSTVINTSINIPVLGRQEIAVPIEASIPIQYTFSIPIDMEYPVSMSYHFQAEIPIEATLPPEIWAALDGIIESIAQGLQ